MNKEMRPCFHIEIVTPKKFILNGLWFGPKKPKRVIIFVHGLTGSLFSMKSVVDALMDKQTAVVTFNNRGFGEINTVKRNLGGKSEWIVAGAGHEVFTESIDDIQGVINFVKKAGVKDFYLAGHSTGCQKAILWANRKGKGVRGIILLAPVSDWAAEVMLQGKKRIDATVAAARALIRAGRKHDLLPKGKVIKRHEMFDAQRILSLYTPDSIEEIFPYAQPKKLPRIFRSVRIPTLVLWAGNDEYSDKTAQQITEWFEEHLYTGEVVVVPKVGHGFKGAEKKVAAHIRNFIAS